MESIELAGLKESNGRNENPFNDGNLYRISFSAILILALQEQANTLFQKKEYPQDIDLLLIMKGDFILDKIEAEAKKLFNYVESRIEFNGDIFWAKENVRNLEAILEKARSALKF